MKATETPSAVKAAYTPSATPRRWLPRVWIFSLVLIIGVIGGIVYLVWTSPPQTAMEAFDSTKIMLQAGQPSGAYDDRPLSVCYDSHEAWVPGKVDFHFNRIKERFSGVRTFQTIGLRNHIDVAAEVGLSIHAGIWIQGANGNVEADMQAAVDGARRHPFSVRTIFVGNEELMGGRFTEEFVLARVRQMKAKLASVGLSIPVGSVQTDGDWLKAPSLAAECDVLGVNIHPFFSGSADSGVDPVLDLGRRWGAMISRFPTKSVELTETGWPTSGRPNGHHVPSMALAEKYANDVDAWVRRGNGGTLPAYFMFHDNLGKPDDFEKAFGLAWASGEWKFGGGSGNPRRASQSKDVIVHGTPAPVAANDTRGTFITSIKVPHANVVAALAIDNATINQLWHSRRVEFHQLRSTWREDDAPAHWTLRGPLVVAASTVPDKASNVSSENAIALCLDAYEPWIGGDVHGYSCDDQNDNQQWTYNGTTHQLQHQRHIGFCLGNVNNEPRLVKCNSSVDITYLT
ncbi:hypothetical protein DYB30_010969 [Aphanomyces astaci]|uniref:glucan endo-1,3-beta-D-glucosidase n=1 Tax=Aphanomyces astaci TaxID=112090 RepID=A0A397C2R5_APHAT|nr:hypothetical protein DYB30_010969 [Aphanomyces astaci]